MSVILFLIVSFICGTICQSISKSRGMEGGFWWGFFLWVIGIIVVAVRPNDKSAPSTSSDPSPERSSSPSSIEGGWKCSFCGKMNYSYEAKCSCGRSRWDSPEPKKKPIQETAKCPQCGANIRSNSKFCAECGTSLKGPQIIICPNCGNENDSKSKYCNECGTDLSGKKKITMVKPMSCIKADSEFITLLCNSCGRVTRFPSSYFTATETGTWIADYEFVCPGCENSIPKGFTLTEEKDAQVDVESNSL